MDSNNKEKGLTSFGKIVTYVFISSLVALFVACVFKLIKIILGL